MKVDWANLVVTDSRRVKQALWSVAAKEAEAYRAGGGSS